MIITEKNVKSLEKDFTFALFIITKATDKYLHDCALFSSQNSVTIHTMVQLIPFTHSVFTNFNTAATVFIGKIIEIVSFRFNFFFYLTCMYNNSYFPMVLLLEPLFRNTDGPDLITIYKCKHTGYIMAVKDKH